MHSFSEYVCLYEGKLNSLKLRFRNKLYALLNKLLKFPGKVYIYSYGGSGTRTFYEFVKKYKLVNGQSNVHWDLVDKIHEADRVIYLYSNPVNAVRSYYRKNDENGIFIEQHCNNLHIEEVDEKKLSEYIAKGVDSFHLFSHYKKFVKDNKYPYEIMIVRFENIWDNLDAVLKYIGLEEHKKE